MRSRLQEDVKHGHVLYELCNDEKRLTHYYFRSVFSQVLEVFNKEEIEVLRFEDALLHSNGPVGKFLSLIGINEVLQDEVNFRYANKSISYEALVLQSAINAKLPLLVNGINNPERDGFIRNLIFVIPGQKITFSSMLEQKIWNLSQPDVTWLDNNFQFEKYTNPANSKHKLAYAWSRETLQYISRILFLQPPEVRKIICNEVYYELLRYFEVLDDENIVEITLFLHAHQRWLFADAALPFLPLHFFIYYRVVGLMGILRKKTVTHKSVSLKIRELLVTMKSQQNGHLQAILESNKGIFEI